MRESMAQLTPRFSTNRTVREYTEQHYLPAASAYQLRSANHGAIGKKIADWQQAVDREWDSLRFGRVRVESEAEQHQFEVELSLDGLDPKAVRVELYADGVGGADPVRQEMTFAPAPSDAGQLRFYRATIPATRPASDYTARVIPQYSGGAVPLECARILWQR
jgi:starch phosphorylase